MQRKFIIHSLYNTRCGLTAKQNWENMHTIGRTEAKHMKLYLKLNLTTHLICMSICYPQHAKKKPLM